MLYLISTPIGNLDDITLRAVKVLSGCDYILCEDTRKSGILLDHLGIKKKRVSFHKFSEKKEEERVLEDLRKGKEIGLISDGGTPILCDPGLLLVKRCIEEGLSFTAIPGCCSLIDAIVLSGFDNLPFQFVGFLPKKEEELRKKLTRILGYSGLSVCFESAKRVLKILKILEQLDETREIALARELTKKFEEVIRGKPKDLIDHFTQKPLKGELILLISPKETDFKDLAFEDLLLSLKEQGFSSKEALKMAAKLRKEKKSDLYKQVIEKKSKT